MKDKSVYVAFHDRRLESTFEELKSGKFQDKKLYSFIDRAINDLKEEPASGIKIPKKLWPKIYMYHKSLEI